MNAMKRIAAALVFVAPLAQARECPAPPVSSAGQAVCYATIYAEKNRLEHAPLRKLARKGKDAWTVRFIDKRPNSRTSGWQVEVDTASGTVKRFSGYRNPER